MFGVSQNIMFLFYQAVMESVIKYGMTVWFGNHSIQSKSNLQHLVQTAMKVMGRTNKLSLQSIYEQSVLRQAQRVLSTFPTSFKQNTSSCLLNISELISTLIV